MESEKTVSAFPRKADGGWLFAEITPSDKPSQYSKRSEIPN